jgi:BirA family transcriptional regulator, biotin operon repressor / biotin---[acetyl-CoA-carboxylase] ligase
MAIITTEELNQFLTTSVLGKYVITVDELPSTNALLKECCDQLGEGALICCDRQTAGRGRCAHAWHSPAGVNLYFSVLLTPPRSFAPRIPQLAMLAALALFQALKKVAPEMPLALKWPNDLWSGTRKLSGILCEGAAPCEKHQGKFPVVMGVGINVNSTIGDFPAELQETAGSLAICNPGMTFNRAQVLGYFLNALEEYYNRWLASKDFTEFADEWRKYDLLDGKNIIVQLPNKTLTGVVCGISPAGLLLLKRDDTKVVQPIYAGDVHIKRESIL